MAFFDFEELEVQVPASDVKPEAPVKPEVKALSMAWLAEAKEISKTAKQPSSLQPEEEKCQGILQIPRAVTKSLDAVEVTLKMYQSNDRNLRISLQATVQELHQHLAPVFGSLRLTGAQLGARERFQRREKGWALEGHQALRPSDQLKSLPFSAVLLCQPRLGPVAEIDLQPLQLLQSKEARSKTADTPITAAVAAAVAEQKCEISPSESRESKLKEPKSKFSMKGSRRIKADADHGVNLPEDLLAQALEMELEIDGRLRLQRDSASQLHQLEVAHGIFSWSTTRVFLVDALNEVLAQVKQAVQGSSLYSKELLRVGFALTLLCEALQGLVLEQNQGLQEVYWSIARPGGLRDSFRGWAATLMHPRRSSNSTSAQAQAMSGLGQVLIQLQNAITPEHQAAKAITALSEELRNPRSQPILEQLGPLRLLRPGFSKNARGCFVPVHSSTSSTSMTWMLAELRSEYKKKEFQVQYKQIGTKRPLFVLEIQSKILPKYGFSGDAKGVLNMKMEVALLSRKDRMIWKLMMDIHKLLDLPDSAAAEILTLDFGAANQVEHEVTSVYQQALQLTTFEKLVAARLHRQRRSLSEGLELLWMRLADPLQPAPVSLRELAAFGAASRESYVLTGASRRRFALDVLSAACGVIATGKALQIVRKLCLDAHPAVVAKSEAVDLVECELPRCFQQPEVNAAPLLLRWQRGDRDIDATEESGVSALHLAAGDNHGPLLSALLILNANRDVRDHLGRTAAHWAASRAQPCLVLLQRAGFDLRAPDLHGRTPLAIARMNGMILQD